MPSKRYSESMRPALLAELYHHEREGLQDNALETDTYLIDGLQEIATGTKIIGDIRGSGLFLGIDLVRECDSREPATDETRLAVKLLRERGVLINSTGVYENILKIRPPLVFSKENVDLLLQKLKDVLNKVQTNPNGG